MLAGDAAIAYSDEFTSELSTAAGADPDILTGGAGADTFRGRPAELDGDRITDFAPEDRILVEGLAFTADGLAVENGKLSFDFLAPANRFALELDGSFAGSFSARPAGRDTVVTYDPSGSVGPDQGAGILAVDDVAAVRAGSKARIALLSNDMGFGSRLDRGSIVLETPSGLDDVDFAVRKGFFVVSSGGFFGDLTFFYTVADRDGVRSDRAGVTISFLGDPDDGGFGVRPYAGDDLFTVRGDALADGRTLKVLKNDGIAFGRLDRSSITVGEEPEHGTVERQGKTFFYTRDAGFTGVDRFTYTVDSRDGVESNEAEVKLVVGGGGDHGPGFADLLFYEAFG